MGFGAFLRTYWRPSAIIAVSAMIFAVGILGDAATLRGLTPKELELAALGLFLIGVMTFFHQMNNRMLAGAASSFGDGKAEPPPGRVIRLDGRRYVPASFTAAFMEFLRTEHTDVQYEAFLAPYVGQWMKLAGFLIYLRGGRDSDIKIAVKPDKDSQMLFVTFGKKWTSHFARINLRDDIEFDAQIRKGFFEGVFLGRAELH